ncbi:MAG: sugar phosphate isomerase/epimerase family protein [Candidatus Omnitrophota bacterium]
MNRDNLYAISTSWNYRAHKDAKGMVDELKALGFERFELNFALTEEQVNDFVKLKDAGDISVTSTHNYCPLPSGVKPKDASPEYYSLASPDVSERALAVKFTKRSMDFVKRLEAKVLVMHLGRIDMEDRTRSLFAISDRARFEKEKEIALGERQRLAKPYLSRAMESLKELLKYAALIGVNLALENRYYINEMPSLAEFKTIFNTIDDEHLFYWHDTGHAQLYENLSIIKHEDLLENLASRLIGVHLHDIMLFDDHRAPGCGEFDFKRLKPYIKPDTLKVIEAHKIATAEEVKGSLKFLDQEMGQ